MKPFYRIMHETFLQDHAGDKREHVYTQEELEQARTHDDLWNAAQVRYYRVLLIKHIMELVSTKDQIHYAICIFCCARFRWSRKARCTAS